MTSIEWTRGDDGTKGKTWNPVRGCTIVSAGCKNCYAMKQAHRFSGVGQPYDGLTQLTKNGAVWTGTARFIPEMLARPLEWKKPARIFVNSMSDLFHDDITDYQVAEIFAVMLLSPWHTYQVLTKRPERMLAVLTHPEFYARVLGYADILRAQHPRLPNVGISNPASVPASWIWLGVSAEDQKTADERIPLLLKTPAAVRFVSMEPLLGPIYFTWRLKPANPHVPEAGGHERGLDWVIVGGESGPGARACEVAWVREIVEQCKSHKVPVFCKQLGAVAALGVEPTGRFRDGPGGRRQAEMQLSLLPLVDRKGGDMEEWPADLRVRQFPEVRHG